VNGLSNYPPGITGNNIPGNRHPGIKRTKKPVTPASFYDRKGNLYVDCSECQGGGNGTIEDKCAAGSLITMPRRGGCFVGTIIPDILEKIQEPREVER